MKPEMGYPDNLMSPWIDNRLRMIEWNMKYTSLLDPYFEQASIEKFTLETLLREISEHNDVSPTEIVERFVQKANKCICENPSLKSSYTLSVSRDIAISILDDLYFGYW